MAKSCCCYTNSSGLNSYYVTEPNAEVISLSPTTLKATKAFACEICYKGFQRYQNLELHRRGHTLPLPWGLWQTVFSMLRKRACMCVLSHHAFTITLLMHSEISLPLNTLQHDTWWFQKRSHFQNMNHFHLHLLHKGFCYTWRNPFGTVDWNDSWSCCNRIFLKLCFL